MYVDGSEAPPYFYNTIALLIIVHIWLCRFIELRDELKQCKHLLQEKDDEVVMVQKVGTQISVFVIFHLLDCPHVCPDSSKNEERWTVPAPYLHTMF